MGFTVLLQTPRIPCPGSIPVEPGTLCSLGIPLWQVTVSTAPSQAPLRPQTLPAPLCYLCPASPALTNMFLLGAQCCSSVPPGCIGREPLQWKAQNRVWVTLHRCGFMSRSCCGLSRPQVTCALTGAIARPGRHGQGRQQWQGCAGEWWWHGTIPVPAGVADRGHHGTDSVPVSCTPPPLGCCHSPHISRRRCMNCSSFKRRFY